MGVKCKSSKFLPNRGVVFVKRGIKRNGAESTTYGRW
jgi:hypothetical protein